ncbi:hypothetical protein GGP41_001534 [Bipolaris sorokiniana]|uniref:Uncharacterized protein n=1 Tax=Cochliobolus sativus TaxID=45130 RepID=A0A8H5ZRM4_COCSA|nr:hypothetical protein GGP41_001534 [Bipolaris sorokiniana]
MTTQGPSALGLSITRDWADCHSEYHLNSIISGNTNNPDIQQIQNSRLTEHHRATSRNDRYLAYTLKHLLTGSTSRRPNRVCYGRE